MNNKWTRPYFGVSHLDFWPDKKHFQVTLEENTCFTRGYILSLKSDKCWSEPIFETIGDSNFVKEELEKRSKELYII